MFLVKFFLPKRGHGPNTPLLRHRVHIQSLRFHERCHKRYTTSWKKYVDKRGSHNLVLINPGFRSRECWLVPRECLQISIPDGARIGENGCPYGNNNHSSSSQEINNFSPSQWKSWYGILFHTSHFEPWIQSITCSWSGEQLYTTWEYTDACRLEMGVCQILIQKIESSSTGWL